MTRGIQSPPSAGFGALLRRWRTLRNQSTNQLARLTGLDRSMISRLETGGRIPSRETVIALADALELEGAHRVAFLASAHFVEHPLTDAQASVIAGWQRAE